jgi:nicotinamidase-related amidase
MKSVSLQHQTNVITCRRHYMTQISRQYHSTVNELSSTLKLTTFWPTLKAVTTLDPLHQSEFRLEIMLFHQRPHPLDGATTQQLVPVIAHWPNRLQILICGQTQFSPPIYVEHTHHASCFFTLPLMVDPLPSTDDPSPH